MSERTSYDQKYFLPLFQAEDKHFWFITRNRILSDVASRLDSVLPENYRALELGCGDGNTLRVLEENCHKGKLIGSDLFYSGLRLAQLRVKCPLVQADVAHLPFGQKFHLVRFV